MKLKIKCDWCGKEISRYHAQIKKFFEKGEIPLNPVKEVMPL